jgi:hypothetical protein
MAKYRKAIAAFTAGLLAVLLELGVELSDAQTNTLRAVETIVVTALVFLFPNDTTA